MRTGRTSSRSSGDMAARMPVTSPAQRLDNILSKLFVLRSDLNEQQQSQFESCYCATPHVHKVAAAAFAQTTLTGPAGRSWSILSSSHCRLRTPPGPGRVERTRRCSSGGIPNGCSIKLHHHVIADHQQRLHGTHLGSSPRESRCLRRRCSSDLLCCPCAAKRRGSAKKHSKVVLFN